MKRRSLLFLAPLAPVALFASRFLGAPKRRVLLSNDVRDQAVQLNQLASGIRTSADAKRLVDFVVTIFAEDLPPALITRSLCNRIAQSEYVAVTDPSKGIPEQHLAGAWNTYVNTVQAPYVCRVSSAEIHNLRDSFLTIARLTWARNNRNIWNVPSIYATQMDGSLASACRAVEAMRILWDLANMPENLRSARDRVQKGILVSEQIRQQQQDPTSSSADLIRFKVWNENPIESAAKLYVSEHGITAFSGVVDTMLNSLLG